MSGVVMRCLATRDLVDAEGNPPPLGYYLKSYDPEAADGQGIADFTPDLDEAMVFPTVKEAVECWRMVPVSRPWRADGMANRPLTAMTMEFIDVEAARAGE